MKIKVLSCFLFLFQISFGAGNIEITNLKTELRNNPLGIDVSNPVFSWILTSGARQQHQTAYEIIVSDTEEQLSENQGNVWATRKMESNKSFGIIYSGLPLESFKRYYWKVRIWDGNTLMGNWSKPAWFETAMMLDSDWKAKWISDQSPIPEKDEDFYKETPNPLLRKEFILDRNFLSARLYITGLGYYVANINGKRTGDYMLDPAWTNYSKQVMYTSYDITELLNRGENAIGVMLGNGWYNPMPIQLFSRNNLRDFLNVGKPCLKAEILIKYSDGSTQTIVTDESWSSNSGPVLKNSVYLGEMYDARLEKTGWDLPGYDFSKWQEAIVVPGPKGHLVAAFIPQIRATRIVKPVNITEPVPGKWLFDFGQNFAGVPRLKVNGPAGTTVILKSGESIHADGTLNILTVIAGQLKSMWNLNGGPGCPDDPSNIITYILKGNGEEVYSPEFTFSSFRYIEMTGFPGKPDLNSLEGIRMNTDLEETGSFTCSNDMFNIIQEVTKWTFLSNVFSVQSDCPAREKFGYGGDIVTTAGAFSYNYDMSGFYRKVVQDFVNDTRPKGGMPEIAPYVGIASEGMGDGTGSPGWQLAFPFTMKVLYDFYGDIKTIENNYEVLRKQVEFMKSKTHDNIVKKDISDHESLDPKPVSLTATAFYYHHVKLLTDFALLLEKEADASKYSKLAAEIKKDFISTFLHKGTGKFDIGTQASQLFAIYYDLVPAEEKSAAMNTLIFDIYNKHNAHLSTGIFATKFMFDVFRQENRNDIAYTIANQRSFPGWGDMIANGATTLHESWVYSDTVPSLNHPMFGSISEWFYKSILGINSSGPGFTSFIIKPQPAGDLTWAKGHFDAVTGRIKIEWKIENGRFYMNISVPANTNASVFIPIKITGSLRENNKAISDCTEIKFLQYRDGYAEVAVESGNYYFESGY